MPSRILAAIAAACAVFTITAAEPVLADGTPTARRPAAKSAGSAQRYTYAYRYVRGQWPGGPDPYAYSYNRPGYYAHYNASNWVPRKQMVGRSRYPLRIPEYYSSWGYPLACKMHGRRNCGVPFVSKPGDPAHYYRRDVQLTQHDHR